MARASASGATVDGPAELAIVGRMPGGAVPRVAIVGGGFGGLYAARALRRAPVEVTLIDRRNHHLFQPLLYQVATAALSPADIAYPIRAILRRQANARVLLVEVTAVDAPRREIVLTDGRLGYDFLVLAAGARHAYFGHDDWEAHAPGLKSLEDALEIRRRILLAFEQAERESTEARRRALLTFVIVGGGPTGVELAGAIGEIARQVLVSDFRAIDPREARVVLIEAGARTLPAFAAPLSGRAEAALRRLGVEVRTGTAVTAIEPGCVRLGTDRIDAATVLWAAGVTASPLGRSLGVPLDRAGRVLVEPDLSVPDHPEIFVIGDLAVFVHQTGTPLPGVAPVAIQQARHVARTIVAAGNGKPREPFRYRDRGNLATIGRAAAVAEIGRVRIAGVFAWLAWLFVHIFFLIGFRNRVIVVFEWAWAYVTSQRGARLITGDIDRGPRPSG
jgi:NADH dehydrogenase